MRGPDGSTGDIPLLPLLSIRPPTPFHPYRPQAELASLRRSWAEDGLTRPQRRVANHAPANAGAVYAAAKAGDVKAIVAALAAEAQRRRQMGYAV